MQGSLREFDLAAVLQVVALGRQYTGVELTFDGGHNGTIFVKSGQVVSASVDDRAGHEAFRDLFQSAEGKFFVYRSETPPQLPEPLGPLNTLLMAAVSQRHSSVPPERSTPYATQEAVTFSGVAPPSPGSRRPTSVPAPVPPETAAAPAPFTAARPASLAPSAPARAWHVAALPRAGSAASGGPKIIAIASPKGGCGKSTIALNLALSFARRGQSVILVDADVNGDVLSAIDARDRAKKGALEVVAGTARLEEALIDTVLSRLKLMPAVGATFPDLSVVAADADGAWSKLLRSLAERADVVLVDTPAGMFGTTAAVLRASTHVVGVLQAEVLAARSFERFYTGLSLLPEEQRPKVVGIVLNMLQTRHHASLGVFQDALQNMPGEWLFDTTIPRHPAFLEATFEGVPLRQLDEDAPPPVAFLFDNLAGEIAERLGIRATERRPQRLLL
jgi:cellulose biosynthesis protein BcsQ